MRTDDHQIPSKSTGHSKASGSHRRYCLKVHDHIFFWSSLKLCSDGRQNSLCLFLFFKPLIFLSVTISFCRVDLLPVCVFFVLQKWSVSRFDEELVWRMREYSSFVPCCSHSGFAVQRDSPSVPQSTEGWEHVFCGTINMDSWPVSFRTSHSEIWFQHPDCFKDLNRFSSKCRLTNIMSTISSLLDQRL